MFHALRCCMSSYSNNKIVHKLYWAFLVQFAWFLFWWCPLLSVDCFHKLCLSGTPSENSQVGWDLGNRMARGYWFDVKWVCPMGSYAWGIQMFCSGNEAPPHFKPPPWTEYLNTSGISSHGTDSLHVRPITSGHPIPKISTPWLFSEGVPARQSF